MAKRGECGSQHASWRGGEKRDKKGYVYVYVGNYNGRAQYKLKHRVVMERFLGRALYKHETVHHKNGDKENNGLSNLELWSKSQPAGQRVEDKLQWAREILAQYGQR